MEFKKKHYFILVGLLGVVLCLILVPFFIQGVVEPNEIKRSKPGILKRRNPEPIKEAKKQQNSMGNLRRIPMERKPRKVINMSSTNLLYDKAIEALRWKSASLNSSDLATTEKNLLLKLPIMGLPSGLDFSVSSLLDALNLSRDYLLRDNVFAWLVKFKKECSKWRDDYFRLAGRYANAVVDQGRSDFFQKPPPGYKGRVVYSEVSSIRFSGRVYFRRENAPKVFSALDKYTLCARRAWLKIKNLIEFSLKGRKKKRSKK